MLAPFHLGWDPRGQRPKDPSGLNGAKLHARRPSSIKRHEGLQATKKRRRVIGDWRDGLRGIANGLRVFGFLLFRTQLFPRGADKGA
jgi:hypothetical protein